MTTWALILKYLSSPIFYLFLPLLPIGKMWVTIGLDLFSLLPEPPEGRSYQKPSPASKTEISAIEATQFMVFVMAAQSKTSSILLSLAMEDRLE